MAFNKSCAAYRKALSSLGKRVGNSNAYAHTVHILVLCLLTYVVCVYEVLNFAMGTLFHVTLTAIWKVFLHHKITNFKHGTELLLHLYFMQIKHDIHWISHAHDTTLGRFCYRWQRLWIEVVLTSSVVVVYTYSVKLIDSYHFCHAVQWESQCLAKQKLLI